MRELWRRLRQTFWFWPLLMCFGAGWTAIAVLAIDRRYGAEFLPGVLRIHNEDGARAILTTLVASIISVTGVVYSMMIVALSFSSNALGPRLLKNFMDRSYPKVLLGGFVSTSVYALIVLASIDREVPQLAVLTATLFALLSFLSLLFFLQQVAVGMQADQVIERIQLRSLQNLEALSDCEMPDRRVDERLDAIVAPQSGYLASIEFARLKKECIRFDLEVRCTLRPGRFVLAEDILAKITGGDASKEQREALALCFHIHHTRTETQDVEYNAQEVVEIALRALSPGLNDPFTAISCIDTLTILLVRFLDCPAMQEEIKDEEGQVRVRRRILHFDDLLATAFHQIRQCSRTMPAVFIRLSEALSRIADKVKAPEHLEAITTYVALIEETAKEAPWVDADKRDLEERLRILTKRLR